MIEATAATVFAFELLLQLWLTDSAAHCFSYPSSSLRDAQAFSDLLCCWSISDIAASSALHCQEFGSCGKILHAPARNCFWNSPSRNHIACVTHFSTVSALES